MKQKKISRGYRLKPQTHELIKKLETIINANSDKVISRACKSYLRKITIEKEQILNNCK